MTDENPNINIDIDIPHNDPEDIRHAWGIFPYVVLLEILNECAKIPPSLFIATNLQLPLQLPLPESNLYPDVFKDLDDKDTKKRLIIEKKKLRKNLNSLSESKTFRMGDGILRNESLISVKRTKDSMFGGDFLEITINKCLLQVLELGYVMMAPKIKGYDYSQLVSCYDK